MFWLLLIIVGGLLIAFNGIFSCSCCVEESVLVYPSDTEHMGSLAPPYELPPTPRVSPIGSGSYGSFNCKSTKATEEFL
jgi:hypothetical protein